MKKDDKQFIKWRERQMKILSKKYGWGINEDTTLGETYDLVALSWDIMPIFDRELLNVAISGTMHNFHTLKDIFINAGEDWVNDQK